MWTEMEGHIQREEILSASPNDTSESVISTELLGWMVVHNPRGRSWVGWNCMCAVSGMPVHDMQMSQVHCFCTDIKVRLYSYIYMYFLLVPGVLWIPVASAELELAYILCHADRTGGPEPQREQPDCGRSGSGEAGVHQHVCVETHPDLHLWSVLQRR